MTRDRRDIDEAIARAGKRGGRRSGGFAARFLSFSASDVIVLIVACVVVGFLLAMFGVDPRAFWADLFDRLGEAFAALSDNFGAVLRYMLYGAIIVVPVWLLLRLVKALR